MNNKGKEKIKVLTIKGVCDVMKCNRQYYYTNIRHLLNPYPTVERRVYYKEEDVLNLQKKLAVKKQRDFEVVK